MLRTEQSSGKMPEVTLLTVQTPGCFWIRMRVGEDGVACLQKLSELEQKLNDLILSVPGRLTRPIVGQNVLVKGKEDRQWYRGTIRHLMQASDGALARVFYVDHGEIVTVNLECLRAPPQVFDSLPWQAKQCTLHNIRPLTLGGSLDFELKPRASRKWDESAARFFRQKIEGQRISIDVVEEDEQGALHVRLYAGNLCLNDLLVEETYAQHADQAGANEECLTADSHGGGGQAENTDVVHLQPHHDLPQSTGAQTAQLTNAPLPQGYFGPPEKRSWSQPQPQIPAKVSSRNTEPKLPDRTLRRLARCLQGMWAEVAYELDWTSMQVEKAQSRAQGNCVEACFVVLQRWSVSGKPPASLVALLQESGFPKEAKDVEAILESIGGLSPANQSVQQTSPSRPLADTLPTTSPLVSSPRDHQPNTQAVADRESAAIVTERSRPPSHDVTPSPPKPRSQVTPPPPAVPKGRGAALAKALIKTPSPGKAAAAAAAADKASPSPHDAALERYRAVTARKVVATTGQTSDDRTGSSCEDRKSHRANSDQRYSRSSDLSDSEARQQRVHGGGRKMQRFDLHCIRQENWHMAPATGDEIGRIVSQRHKGMRQQGPSGFALVRGHAAPEPVADVASMASFPDTLVQRCAKCDLTSALTVQSYCWPAIMRGHDLVCIAGRKSGKTLSHCVPLLAKIMHPSHQSSLPKGIGPLALVLLPSWEGVVDAHTLYDNLGLGTHQVPCRSFAVHGGGSEEEQVTKMMNGCEVMVATPMSLLRLLKKRQTSLGRLCHLVLDDCDELAELFLDEVKEVMQLLEQSLASDPFRPAPQVLLYTCTWSPKVDVLREACVQNPLTVVCSKLEMAVSMKCTLLAHVCTAEQRFTELRRLVDTVTERQRGDRIVICSASAQHAVRIQDIFRRYSHTVLCAHENLVQDESEAVFTQWRAPCGIDSVPILVITDAVLLKMRIDDAQCVIHFDFPLSSKTAFGNRLDCLREGFMSGAVSTCSSHLFVTEDTVEAAHHLLHLLRRFGADVPDELVEQSKEAVRRREEKRRGAPLCSNLLLWGRCRQFNEGKASCASRHAAVGEIDRPADGLPTDGYVKVLVMGVESASQYWARLVSHRPLNSSAQTKVHNRAYLQLTMDIAMYYGSADNHVQKDNLKVGDLCACLNAQQVFCRARVLELMHRAARPVAKMIMIDEGREVVVKLESVMELPDHLAKVPQQAIQIVACCLKPCDKEERWTPQANELAKTLLNRTLNGKIVLSMAGRLWLDPLIEQQLLSNLHILETTLSIRHSLREKKLAMSNPKHLETLCEMMSDWAPKQTVSTVDSDDDLPVLTKLDQMGLPMDSFAEVLAIHIDSPSRFYVRLDKSSGQLEELQAWIHESGRHGGSQMANTKTLHIGAYVLALASDDDCWYRAKILARQGEEFAVQYIDFGNWELRRVEQLKLLLRDPQVEVPAQAICCSLADLSPTGDSWSGEEAYGLAGLVDSKVLLAKAKAVTEDETGDASYVVELYDSSGGHDVLIAEGLAIQGLGALAPSALSFLIPEDTSVADYVESLADAAFSKLPDLCRCLLHYKDADLQQDLAVAIHSLLWSNKSRHGEFVQTSNISMLCRSLEVVGTDAAREHIVATLGSLATSTPRAISGIASHGGVRQICQFLTPLSASSLVENCCYVLKLLSETSQEMRDVIRDAGCVRSMCQLLTLSSQDPKVVEVLVSAMLAFAANDTRNCEVLRNEGAVQAAVKIFSLETGTRSQEHVARCLEVIAQLCPRALPTFRSSGAIASLANVMAQCHNDKSMMQFIRTLKVMLADDESNIDYASSIGLHATLGSILSRRCGMMTRGLAMELQRRVPPSSVVSRSPDSSAPSHRNSLDGVDTSDQNNTPGADHTLDLSDLAKETSWLRPKIIWAQRRGFVKMSFCLPDVEKRHLDIGPNMVTFRTVVNGQVYAAELALFGDVTSSNMREKFSGTAYSLILIKKEQCFWPRLLRNKAKVPYITLDFDNYDDSDEERERNETLEWRRERAQRDRLLKGMQGGPPDSDDTCDSELEGSDDDPFFDGFAPF